MKKIFTLCLVLTTALPSSKIFAQEMSKNQDLPKMTTSQEFNVFYDYLEILGTQESQEEYESLEILDIKDFSAFFQNTEDHLEKQKNIDAKSLRSKRAYWAQQKYRNDKRLAFSVLQDLRFATIGDKETKNYFFTLDIILRLELTAFRTDYGFFILGIELEHAELSDGKFVRYGFFAGITWTKIGGFFGLGVMDLNRFEINASIHFSRFERRGEPVAIGPEWLPYPPNGLSGRLSYNISDHLRLDLMGMYMSRPELVIKYGSEEYHPNVYFGITYRSQKIKGLRGKTSGNAQLSTEDHYDLSDSEIMTNEEFRKYEDRTILSLKDN